MSPRNERKKESGNQSPIGRVDDCQMVLRRTRTATRRSGDDYQDLVAAKAMLSFLKHPSLFRWIKLEAREAGKLDDVVVSRADDTVEATQVKFSTDVLRPGDPLIWEDLLDRGNQGNSPSLIQQWWNSVLILDEQYGRTEPRLFSNRRAGDDLFLTATGRINHVKTSPDVLEQIEAQLGDNAHDFIDRFHFEINEQGLADLKERLLRDFQSLGLPATNWLGFMDAIRSWIRCESLPPNGELRISDIRQACGWTQLSPLTQELEVPGDYVLADKDFHEDLRQRAMDGNEPAIVLTAGPGIGKSTYLSYLVGSLQESGCSVVRHHYSLGPGRDRPERVEAYRIAESLMADLQTVLPSYLGGVNTQNPNPAQDLRVWLQEIGKGLAAEGKHVVIVVDGLDHVWRAQDSRDELNKLFDQLLPAPAGVVVMVGTQPVQDQQLPTTLLTYAPRQNWVELPPLRGPAVREWLDHHHNLMPSAWFEGQQEWRLVQLAEALHERTGGHPLLNRYIIERIAVAGEFLTSSAVQGIPETPANSVEQYYRSLWANVPQYAKDVMFLFAIASFRWPLDGLYEALQLAGYEQASAIAGVDAVRHLLGNDHLGWRPFHNSVLLFASEQPEFQSRENALRQAAIAWLEEKAPAYLRRSRLWLLQLEAGDPCPLISGADRRWVIEAIAAGDSLAEVGNVLQAAAYEAIKGADFPKYVDRGILADVVEHSAPIHYGALRWMLEAQLSMEGGDDLAVREMTRLSELSDSAVASLALYAHQRGDDRGTSRCFDEMRRRFNRESGGFVLWEETQSRPMVISELAALHGLEPKRFANFVGQFPTETVQAAVTESWISGLRHSGDLRRAIDTLGESIGPTPDRWLSRYVAVVGAREGIALSDAERQLLVDPYSHVYDMLVQPGACTGSPAEPTPPVARPSLELGAYVQAVAQYVHDLFFCWLVREFQSQGHAAQWNAPAGLQPWLASALNLLAECAEDIARRWHETGTVSVTTAYRATRSLELPALRSPYTDDDCARGLEGALLTITEDLLVFQRTTGGSPTLTWDEVETIASHRFAGSRAMIGWIAEGIFSVEEGATDKLCQLADEDFRTTVEPYGERATALAMLAAICARQGLADKAEKYLHQAGENLIGYGYHKDLLLDTTLNVLDIVGDHLDSRQAIWDRLSPAIGAVQDFTDGDETKHLVAKFEGLMLRFDTGPAVENLMLLMDDEQYWDVQQALRELVSTGDLTDPDIRALVSTCIEPDAIESLLERAGESYEPAGEVLDLMPRYSSNLSRANVERAAGQDDGDAHGWATKDALNTEQCLEYPPERLDELIRRGSLDSPYNLGNALCTWLCCWADTERARDALDAVEPYLLNDDTPQVNNEVVRATRRIVGSTQSYKWLVKAHRSNHGWHEHWTSAEEARERWRWLKRDFPGRQHAFLVATISPERSFSWHFGMTVARLAEYLGYFNRWEDACAIAQQLVDTVSGLVSGQQLPVSPWAVSDGEDR